ncbi:phosphotransferase [Streptomyces fungicidicus]|uniref:Phosphotransferase n=1 Tax=Streptomyces fungicidicus TaxID=68203 RepID=A0ACC7XW58_9ACTN|nr:phosphotransferase [Streptomyces fungicidicus]NUV73870.1 phosphotransferase [Streptomyces fungicidicus]
MRDVRPGARDGLGRPVRRGRRTHPAQPAARAGRRRPRRYRRHLRLRHPGPGRPCPVSQLGRNPARLRDRDTPGAGMAGRAGRFRDRPRPVEAGLSALAALTHCLPDARRLIRGDLLSRNALAGEAGITGVLDWGNALYGDPLYDAAWLPLWWPWYPGWRPRDLHAALLTHWCATGPTPAHLRERLHAYLLHIALDALAYCAYRGRWDEVRAHVGTVLTLAPADGGESVLIPAGA